MAVGKEIKVSLSLDDSGFSVKVKGAGQAAQDLQKVLGGLSGQTDKTETAIANLSSSFTGFTENFGALQKSLTASVQTLTDTITRSFTDMSGRTRAATKDAEDSATRQINARERVLRGEIDTNRKLIESRAKMYADLKRAENDATNRALAGKAAIDQRRDSYMKAPIGTVGQDYATYAADTAALQKDVALHERNAQVIGQEAAKTAALVTAMREEQAVRNASLGGLQKEREMASITAAIAKSNAAEVARTKEMAAKRAADAAKAEQKANADGAALAKQLSDEQVRGKIAEEAAKTRAAREAAAERARIARQEAEQQRQQAKAVADMWKGMAQMYAGAKIEGGLKASVGDADDDQRARIMVKALNLPKNEEKNIFDKSQKMSDQLGFLSTKDAIKSQMSAISSLGYNHTDVIDQTLPTFVKAANNMDLLGGGHGDLQSTLRNLYGITEMRQQTADPEAMIRTANIANKTMVGTAGKVTLPDMENVLRRQGAGAKFLSDDGFVNMMGLIDQFKTSGGDGGSGGGVATVGTIVKAIQAYANGKTKSNKAVQETIGAGILDTDGLDLSKDKAEVLHDAKNGSFKNKALWMSDPIKAIQQMMPQIVEYTQRHKKEFYTQGMDPNSTNDQMLAANAYLQKMGIAATGVQAITSVGSPAARERLNHQSATINQSDTVDQTAARLADSYAGKMQNFQGQMTNFKVIVGDTLLPVLGKMLEYASKITIAIRSMFQDNEYTAKLSVFTAALGGAVLTLKGFVSMFGSAGVTSVLRSFVGLAPAAANSAGIIASGVSKLGIVFKWMAGIMLAWDVGQMIGAWLGEFKVGGMKLNEQLANIFIGLEEKYNNYILNMQAQKLKLRNALHIDSDEETKKGMDHIQDQRDGLKKTYAVAYYKTDKEKAEDAKKNPPKAAPKKAPEAVVGPATEPGNDALADQLGKGAGKPRGDRDPLNKALEEEIGRMNQAKEKMQDLAEGGETIDTLRREAIAQVKGKLLADDLSKDHLAKNRPDFNSAKVQQLVDATQKAMLYNEQVKAIEYVNERVAATGQQASEALAGFASGGVAKQTDAFKALNSELIRTEERLGAGVKKFAAWDEKKAHALFNQATTDAVDAGRKYQKQNPTDDAALLPTERARNEARLAATRKVEDDEYSMLKDNLDKRYQDEYDATIRLAQFKKKNQQETSDMLLKVDTQYDAARDDLDKSYSERRRIRAEQEVRELESGADRTARQWLDTQKAVDDAGASAMNSFVSMIDESLKTGRMNVKGFITGVLSDIMNAKLKETLANPLKNIIDQGTNWVGTNLFGLAPSAGPGGNAAAAARDAATAAETKVTYSNVSALTAMVQAVEQASAALREISFQQAGGGGGFGGLSSLFGGADGGIGMVGEDELGAMSMPELPFLAAFADGGIMTNSGPLQLRKYANGGIANSPQLAMYGEAGPEAYVPLPDGRTIPVTISSGGGQQAAGGAPAVQVNVINQTSTSVTAAQGQPRFDGKQTILDVVLTAASTPGTFRNGMQSAMKGS